MEKIKGFLLKIRDKFIRFMYGRYGADEFYKFIMAVVLGIIIVNIFFRTFILSTIEFIVFAYGLYRFFSRNIQARRKENTAYLKVKNGVMKFFRIGRAAWRDRKTKIYKRCPSCREVLQIPRTMKGKSIKCPKCSSFFRL